MEDRWLSVDEIAAYLGIKRDTVYKWIDHKDMPAHKVGRLWKFKKVEVDEWVRREERANEAIAVGMMVDDELRRFGFRFGRGGTHGARTMMLDELRGLLAFIKDVDAAKDAYIEGIKIDNCLGKRFGKARELTAKHLAQLYV